MVSLDINNPIGDGSKNIIPYTNNNRQRNEHIFLVRLFTTNISKYGVNSRGVCVCSNISTDLIRCPQPVNILQ